jgi:hypothetical protein
MPSTDFTSRHRKQPIKRDEQMQYSENKAHLRCLLSAIALISFTVIRTDSSTKDFAGTLLRPEISMLKEAQSVGLNDA